MLTEPERWCLPGNHPDHPMYSPVAAAGPCIEPIRPLIVSMARAELMPTAGPSANPPDRHAPQIWRDPVVNGPSFQPPPGYEPPAGMPAQAHLTDVSRSGEMREAAGDAAGRPRLDDPRYFPFAARDAAPGPPVPSDFAEGLTYLVTHPRHPFYVPDERLHQLNRLIDDGDIGRIAATVLGQRVSAQPEVAAAWERARHHVLGRPANIAALQQHEPRRVTICKGGIYDQVRRRFWVEVARDPVATEFFAARGAIFTGTESQGRAPLMDGFHEADALQWDEFRISLDHLARKADEENWRFALESSLLEFATQADNRRRDTHLPGRR